MKLTNLFRKKYRSKDEMYANLCANIIRPIDLQLTDELISANIKSPADRKRCRLNIYTMNYGIVSFFILKKYSEIGNEIVYGLINIIIEILLTDDPEIINSIEELILDIEFKKDIKSRLEKMDNYNPLNKNINRTLFAAFLQNRQKTYYNSISYWLSQRNKILKGEKVDEYKITVIAEQFIKDYFGGDINSHLEFAYEFSLSLYYKTYLATEEEIAKYYIV